MEKEGISELFALFTTMREYSAKMKQAIEDNDAEKLEKLKKEILEINKSADRLL